MPARPPASKHFFRYAALVVTLIATILVFQGSREMSLTIDEPNHVYCGTEYLQYGTYSAWPENPPLSRMLVALGPYLNGHRIKKVRGDMPAMNDYFNASYDLSYYAEGPVREQLFWSRLFVIPMFLLSAWVVWRWSKSLAGDKGAFLATGMYATLPAILAHSGLATTDMCFVACFMLSTWLFSRWLRRPTMSNAALLGTGLAAALLSKYSMVGFFPPAAGILVLLFLVAGRNKTRYSFARWFGKAFRSGIVACLVTGLLVWAAFGFSYGRLGDQPVIRAGINEQAMSPRVGHLALPAPEWFAGLKILLMHNADGHRSYLEETVSSDGFWNYYPVIILLKTPWPYLIVLMAGLVGAWLGRKTKRGWEMLAVALLPFSIVVGAMPSNINLGVRHILLFYPLGAIAGAAGIVYLLQENARLTERIRNGVLVFAVVAQMAISLVIFPDFLSYFNAFAGREPGVHLTGSDLDWGQGLFELEQFCRSHKVDTLHLAYYGLIQDCWFDLPPLQVMSDTSRPRGWIAVSENLYRGMWVPYITPMDNCNKLSFGLKPTYHDKLHDGYRWLDRYKLAGRVGGGSIRLYYVP